MSASTSSTPKGLLPTMLNGVPIIHCKAKEGCYVPAVGPSVVVAQGKTKLYDEFDDKLATARVAVIVAYQNGTEVWDCEIRTTRWYSGKLRWRIKQRVEARIRKAVGKIT